MLSFLPAWLRGVIAALLLIINTLICCSVLFTFALIKLLPIAALKIFCTRAMIRIAEFWMACNSGWMALSGKTEWDLQG
ncbi:MAG: acyltransferase, partial [Pseudomonas sp.]